MIASKLKEVMKLLQLLVLLVFFIFYFLFVLSGVNVSIILYFLVYRWRDAKRK